MQRGHHISKTGNGMTPLFFEHKYTAVPHNGRWAIRNNESKILIKKGYGSAAAAVEVIKKLEKALRERENE